MSRLLLSTLAVFAPVFSQTLPRMESRPKPAEYTYYVDSIHGSDANRGSEALPWKTVAKVNATALSPGQSVGFKRGATWNEQLHVGQSGSAGKPIKFGAYGSGGNPVFNGSDVLAGWTEEPIGTPNLTEDPNIRAYWDFEDSSSPWLDGTANHNDLGDSGAAAARSTEHKQGNYSVNVSSGQITRGFANLSGNFPLKESTTAYTFGGWIQYTNAKPGGYPIFFAMTGDYAHTGIWSAISPAGHILLVQCDSGGTQRFLTASDTTLVPGTWNHVVFRWDGTVAAIFVNGVKDSHTLSVSLSKPAGGQLALGIQVSAWFDEWFAFDRVLSDVEISGIYDSTLAGTTFAGYYKDLAAQPHQVFEDGARYRLAAGKSALTPGSFWWDPAAGRVYLRTIEDANPSGHTMEVSQRHGVLVIARSYVTLEGLDVEKANGAGIAVEVSSNVIITNCSANFSSSQGILIESYSGMPADENQISHSSAAYNLSSGIGAFGSAELSGLSIQNNVAHDNATGPGIDSEGPFTAGIRTFQVTNLTLEYNTSYNNGVGSTYAGQMGQGVWNDTPFTGNVIRFNTVFGNRRAGIVHENAGQSSDAKVYGNIAYGNGTYGIWLYRATGGVLIANNTLYGNNINLRVEGLSDGSDSGMHGNVIEDNLSSGAIVRELSAVFGGENAGTLGGGNVYSYNGLGLESSNFLEWGEGVYKSTYSSFDLAYGSSTHSVAGDPLFTNPPADFTLRLGSPGIGAALCITGVTRCPANLGAIQSMAQSASARAHR